MKNNLFTSLFVCLICLLPVVPVQADEDCDQALREAKTAYNAGNYSKAKSLYDYVASECGNNYGSAASMSQKCKDALTPKLSVSRTNISVGASAGTTSVTVSGNRTWKLANTNSSLFTVTRNGDNISISYVANPNTTERTDYFDVQATDGSKSVRVYVKQAAKEAAPTPYLTVDKTSISSSYSGKTAYVTVSSNVAWELLYASGTMYNVTRSGNTLTVTIHENTTTDSRSDYFKVKTSDGTKEVKISLSQDGKPAPTGPTATIASVNVDHNTWNGNLKGMKIHVDFTAYDVLYHSVKVCIYFHFQDGNALNGVYGSGYITSDGKVTCQSSATANYTNTHWSDFSLFMPYNYLNMSAGCKNVSLEGQVGIYDDTAKKWLTSDYTKFYFTFSN